MAAAALAPVLGCGRGLGQRGARAASLLWSTARSQSSQNTPSQPRHLPKTSLTEPPWPKINLPDPIEEAKQHREIVQKVNELIATGQYGRLFAVVHFASRQWKVTDEDLILIENHIPAECGDRIRMEKVLLVGANNFTLLGKPLLGKDLVRVEATVIEKTESWPRVNMRFRPKRHFQRKRIVIQPQTVLRINSIEIAPALS
ncbi:large ribosomal subunit protein bL21m isoform X3 [Anolis sagrei]|uniref:large ribosomal subunit protein bL21m isoform X3 n=1 Tax=Anolis sagrei TaxID=38937 RepID=UPI00295BF6D9|nr:large ribosomal subunit protein bL21m isoform X2 [Anolis sagrei ordinatus]